MPEAWRPGPTASSSRFCGGSGIRESGNPVLRTRSRDHSQKPDACPARFTGSGIHRNDPVFSRKARWTSCQRRAPVLRAGMEPPSRRSFLTLIVPGIYMNIFSASFSRAGEPCRKSTDVVSEGERVGPCGRPVAIRSGAVREACDPTSRGRYTAGSATISCAVAPSSRSTNGRGSGCSSRSPCTGRAAGDRRYELHVDPNAVAGVLTSKSGAAWAGTCARAAPAATGVPGRSAGSSTVPRAAGEPARARRPRGTVPELHVGNRDEVHDLVGDPPCAHPRIARDEPGDS